MEFDAEAFNEVVEGIRNLAHGILNDVWPVMPPAMDFFLDRLSSRSPCPAGSGTPARRL